MSVDEWAATEVALDTDEENTEAFALILRQSPRCMEKAKLVESSRLRWSRILVWAWASLATVLFGSALVFLTDRAFFTSVTGHLDWNAILAPTGVLMVVTSVWLSLNRRPFVAVGLAVLAVALLVPIMAAWPYLREPVRAAMAAMAPLAVAGAAQVGLRWPSRGESAPALPVIYALSGLAAAVLFMWFNPFDEPRCGLLCMDIDPLGPGAIASRTALGIAGVCQAAGALLAVRSVVRWSSRMPVAVTVSSLFAMVVLPLPLLWRWLTWSSTDPWSWVETFPFIAAIVVGGAVIRVTVREARTRDSLRTLVEYVADPAGALSSDPEGPVRDGAFFVPHTGLWVNAMGSPSTLPDSEAVVISDQTGPVVRLLVAPGYRSDDVLDAMTPGLRLALKTSQLMATFRAGLIEVQASRRRIVATSDRERRRIERDLHDGAQQRLVGAMFYLSLAKARPGAPAEEIGRVENEVGRAIEELRALAHGVFPNVLSDEGLWAALDELCRSSVPRAELAVSGVDDMELESAMAVYATIARALEIAKAPPRIRVRCNPDDGLSLWVHVVDGHTTESDWIDVIDRVGAVGGQLHISAQNEGLLIEAEVPCG